jgi:hypothetical protein
MFVMSTVSVVVSLWLTASRGGAVWPILVSAMPVLGLTGMGVLLCLRAPGNVIGWLFLGLGVVVAVRGACDAYAAPGLALPGVSVAVVGFNVVSTLRIPLVTALLLVFPDGRLPSPRWRLVAFVWGAAVIAFTLVVVGGPGTVGLRSDPSRQNPIGIGVSDTADGVVSVTGLVSSTILLIAMFVAAVSLIVRLRNASGVPRQQLKWFGTAAAVFALTVATKAFAPWSQTVAQTLTQSALTLLVVATGIAILRYRLYEIDVIIRRTLVYTTLVGSLAVVYLGCIYLLDRALQAFTGQSGAFAVTLSTLAVAALFQPLRRRIQHRVDHRFYRAKYSAAATLDGFSNRLRDQIDLDALHAEVLDVVNSTLQPRHATLWIRPPERERVLGAVGFDVAGRG